MKRFTLFILLSLYVICGRAAKAHSLPVTVTQSDGTQLTAICHGDEDFHYYTTVDGVILHQIGTSFYIAAIDEKGERMSTGQLAHNKEMRSTVETRLIEKQNREMFYKKADVLKKKARVMREPIQGGTRLFPHTGKPRTLVILAEFSDTPFKINSPKEAFNEYLNAEGELKDYGNFNHKNYGSVRKYFKDMSFGQFEPQFDVYGPVKLDNPLAYYGEDTNNRTDRMDRLIPDVCKAADGLVDFSDYDADGDGYVDLIYIIYAGYAQSITGNSSDCIWPKSGSGSFSGTYDNKKIYRYGVSNELSDTPAKDYTRINGIGLFCHEFSHTMGMPDLYATNKVCQNADNQQLEYWSIMDGGTYTANGRVPTAYTAWEREAFGWFEIGTLENKGSVSLSTIDNGGKAYRIMNDNDKTGNEYLIVQNIQKEGWNSQQLGHGMLVFHVDYDANAFNISYNSVNNTLGHPRMTIIPADGRLMTQASATAEATKDVSAATLYKTSMEADPFPGTKNVTSLTDEAPVKPLVYTSQPLNKPLLNIKENTETGVVTFDFIEAGDPTGIDKPTVSEQKDIDKRIFSVDGRYVGTDNNGLKKGIYIRNGKKIVVR
ncbi:M6 family metalloprotease domain-containing protein [Xylanibacter caecicola]|uniref:M6 family metalloprotease domain-containing protein n=1 Tax=Xylanibacter caecicola TaxID=2736294 RepID=UPI00258E8F41|nr:M6 family metalloprotease domain-containing protein [Xylanibacter caecicola]